MKKPAIFLFAIVVSLMAFLLLSKALTSVSEYLANKYKPNYITPTSKDSTYMELLMDTTQRKTAMDISRGIRPFYILSDSIITILDAGLSRSLISEILLDKNMVQDLRAEMLRLEQERFITCPTSCWDSLIHNKELWLEYISNTPLSEIKTYIHQQIEKVEEGEHLRLLEER